MPEKNKNDNYTYTQAGGGLLLLYSISYLRCMSREGQGLLILLLIGPGGSGLKNETCGVVKQLESAGSKACVIMLCACHLSPPPPLSFIRTRPLPDQPALLRLVDVVLVIFSTISASEVPKAFMCRAHTERRGHEQSVLCIYLL